MKRGSTSVSKHYLAKFRILTGVNQVLDFIILGCHLLAYPTSPLRCCMREAQAHAIRQFVKESTRENATEIIILGDLNDFDESVKVPYPNSPISRVSWKCSNVQNRC